MPNCSSKHIFLCSKTITQILIWVTLIAVIYETTDYVWPYFLVKTKWTIGEFWTTNSIYAMLTLALIFFPLGGLLGDVYWGRYKTVVCGLVVTAVSMVLAFISSMLTINEDWSNENNIHTLIAVMITITYGVFVFGSSFFISNVIQFGLDQLMEKPSESLGVFVHWFTWTLSLSEATTKFLNASSYCISAKTFEFARHFIHCLPAFFFVLLILFLIIAYCTRRHFNRDRVKYNPYKMIFKVLNFARKNKYPVGPVSAFARCYNYRPSRLDYAKERYGGPFTTSDVEDVKAFKNVFLVLLALGPVFTLETPTSLLFSEFSLHIGNGFSFGNETCQHKYNVETFSYLVTLTAFPIYIWVIYSIFRSKPVKIFHRLMAGILLYIFTMVSMLAIDLAGHVTLYTQNQTQPVCMFAHQENQTLNIHWGVVFVPAIAKGLSSDIVIATSLEFISAQSPHTMQGVLVGSAFALQGIFRTIGGLFLIPFALKNIWKNLEQHPPVVSCGFGYYLVCITVAVIGFISFIVAVKRYKYRRRDEEPYSQACVEEIFARRIEGYRNHYKDYEELPGTNEY